MGSSYLARPTKYTYKFVLDFFVMYPRFYYLWKMDLFLYLYDNLKSLLNVSCKAKKICDEFHVKYDKN